MTRLKNFLLAVMFIFAMGAGVTAAPAFAGQPAVDNLPADGSAPFKLANQDYFVGKLLTGFLGPVVNPNGDSATTTVKEGGNLGEIFRTYNLGIAFFGTLIVMFLTVAGVLQSGHDGEFLGKKWSSMWVPIRFTIGSALMLPLSSTGYSFVQAMVLWIAVQGIGFADTIWTTIVNRMVLGVGTEIWGVMPSEKLARGMLNSAVCATALNTYTKNGPAPTKIGFYGPTTEGILTKTKTWSWGDPSAPEGSSLRTACGTFSLSYTLKDWTTPAGLAHIKVMDEHEKQVQIMATDLVAGADHIGAQVIKALESDKEPAQVKADLAALEVAVNQKAMKLAQNYSKAIAAAADKSSGGNTEADKAQKIAELTEYGFASAGAYYIELTRLQSAVSSAVSAAPAYTEPNFGFIEAAIPVENFSSVMDYFARVNSGGSAASVTAREAANLSTNSGNGNVLDPSEAIPGKAEFLTDPKKAVEKSVNTFSNKLLWTLVGTGKATHGGSTEAFRASSFDSILNSNSTGSAVLELKRRGDIILDYAGAIYLAKTLLKATIFAAHEGVSNSIAAKAGAAGPTGFAWSVVEDLAGLLTAAISAWIAFGFMLAVYVPMVPYILWTGGLVGCLVLIAEALVACQLWAVMIIHPSGDGITSDHSRQGVMMLLVLFARGALMTMGLVMGVYMVDPLVTMVNDTFLVAKTVLQKGTNFTGLFETIGFAVIYTSLILSVVNRSFSMINTLPDKVLGWIGGHAARLGESSARDDARGMINNAGDIAGKGGTGALLGDMKEKGREGFSAGNNAPQMS